MPWLGFSKYAPPVATPIGLLETVVETILPFMLHGSDGRGYQSVALPNIPVVAGIPIHAQATTLDLNTSTFRITNCATYQLR